MSKKRKKIKIPESLPLFNGIYFDAYLIDGETLEVVPTKEAKDLWFFNRSNVQGMVAEMQQIMLRDSQIRSAGKRKLLCSSCAESWMGAPAPNGYCALCVYNPGRKVIEDLYKPKKGKS